VNEVLELVKGAGFDVSKSYYSLVNDLTFINTSPNDYLRIGNYGDLIKIAIKRPTGLNILRTFIYPIPLYTQ